MNSEKIEQLAISLKESVDKFNEKKNPNRRRDVRKILQSLKTVAQEMRVAIMKETQ